MTDPAELEAWTTTALPQHRRLIALSDLDHRHHGYHVHVAGLTGTFVGIVPLDDKVQLTLIVGGCRAWTDWLPAGDAAEVWK
jgi:hypothetical protein